jgi:SUR7/PalI family protein
MLKPATPLSVVFLVAFVLLLLPSLSTPVVKSIPLGQDDDTSFGVWGFCKGDDCSPIQIGYAVPDLSSTAGAFNLQPESRHTISFLLIVHPIAAFFTLICLVLALGAHFRNGAHSTRYLFCLFFMTIPTLLFCLLAFLVDVLLFIPHIALGGWLVLGGTIAVFIGSIVSCGIRRTLIARKKQRQRIAENAEMSGENYYNRQAVKATIPRIESPPMSNESVSPYQEKAMGFSTTFDMKPNASNVTDDRIPLNPTNNGGFRTMGTDAETNRYNNNPPPPNDRFGLPRGPAMGMAMGAAMPYQRGRGGYGGPLRGGFPPRGGGRGGYPPNGNGTRGPPPGFMNGPRGRRVMNENGYDDGTGIDSYYENSSGPLPGPYGQNGRSNSPSPPLPTSSPATGPGASGPIERDVSPLEDIRKEPSPPGGQLSNG